MPTHFVFAAATTGSSTLDLATGLRSPPGFLEKDVDAVFIDVAEPWTIIPHLSEALKGGHHVVSWSPNVEQVKSTVEVLKELNFKRITVREIADREMLVRERGVRPRERGITHTAYLVRGKKILR